MEVAALGRFTIVRQLGRGEWGRVFLARDPRRDGEVVVRTFDPVASLPEGERARAIERALGEARSTAAVNHQGVAAILDAGEADGIPYVVTDFVAGESLDGHLAPGTLLDPRTVVALIAGIADGLGPFHAAGVVHGRIKPSKIHRVGPRAARLRDLGIGNTLATATIASGDLPIVPDYLAPEQVKGGPVDGRTDLFALAVVLFETLVGERPFAGDAVPSVLFRIVHEPPRDLDPHVHRVPPGLARFLLKALSKSPDDRYPDAATFAAELRRAAEEIAILERSSPAATSPDAIPPPPAPPRRRSMLPFVTAASLVVVAFAVGIALLARGGSSPVLPATFSVSVVAEPDDAQVTWNGRPVTEGRIEVPGAGPFGALAASKGCRRATYELSAEDAARIVTLVLDPERAPVTVDAGLAGAALRVNGAPSGASPRQVELDLCRENVVEASAAGYRNASVVVPTGATPMEAARALAALRLEEIPRGKLVLPPSPVPVIFYINGNRVPRRPGGIDLPEGEHEVRAVNEEAWIDVRSSVKVEAGRRVEADLAMPPLGRLVVQSFPSNAKVFLRRGKEEWVFVDEVPVEKRIAAGTYRVRVEFVPTGASQERDAVLRAGQTAQLRFSFGAKR